MVSGSVIESHEVSDNNSDQASLDESKWNLFENPVGHPHHTKQSSGIIHSPSDHSTHWIEKFLHSNGRVAQLVLIYPIGRSTLSSLQTSDISGIVSTVQEYGGSILDYIPENSLLVRFPLMPQGFNTQ